MPVCNICLDLNSGALVDPGGRIIHQDLAALRDSVRNGCQLCTVLEGGMSQMGLLFNADTRDHQVKLCITVQSGMSIKMTARHPALTDFDEVELEFYTEHDAPTTRWSVFGPATTVPERLDLCHAIDNIRCWLNECRKGHENCSLAPIDGGILPRRVLDLEPSDHQLAARLIDSSGLRERYVALSHCWGGNPSLTITTTATTIAQRQRGMGWDELPKTFRDAVLITKGLGIRFLWIDSLCIVQEDKSDWEEESAKMASTYSNCYLNLAATHACNGAGGCLSQRWIPTWTNEASYNTLSQRQPVMSHMICIGGEATGIFVRRSLGVAHAQCTSDLAHEYPLDQTAPLLSRAWCYQERLLSPRTVHFHSSEMVWHCMEVVSCECGSLNNIDAMVEYLGRATFPKYTFQLLNTHSRRHYQIVLWLTMVHQYSKMRLTHPDDVLPALGGVALRFKQRVNPGRYLAGLWECELAMCLLWQIYSNPETNPTRKYVDTRRPAMYRAPTWSWASIDCDTPYRAAISYYEVINYSFEVGPDFSIVNVFTELDGVNEFGRVVSGMLQVRCRVVDGLLDQKLSQIAFKDDREISLLVASSSLAESFSEWHEVNLDCVEYSPHKAPSYPALRNFQAICCLIVGGFEPNGNMVAVVVQELEGERVGYIHLDSDLAVIETAPVRVVELI